MQEVKMSKEIFDLFEKNTVLDYEQARWYTQKGGYIPIPRKANKKNIKVVFLPGYFWGYICLSKLKVRKYKLSQIVDNDEILGFIVSFEVNKSTIKQNHYFIDSVKNDIYLLSKQFFFEEFEYIEDNNFDYISDFC